MWWLLLIPAFIFVSGKMGNEGMMIDPFFQWDDLIRKYSKIYGVPFEWMKAIMMNESNLGQAASVKRGLNNPKDIEASKSSDGKSWGLMQLTLPTAREIEPLVTEVGLNDPDISVRIAAKYLARLGKLKNWDQENTIRSYNGGPGWKSTKLGPSMTEVYYRKFLSNLATVKTKNKLA